jgi:hypothetical protein
MAKMTRVGAADRKQQLFLRSMTNGNLAERDRLLEYTTGEFYQEFSLYLSECDAREKEMKEMMAGR